MTLRPVFLSALLVACTAEPRTEVLLVVDAEPAVRSMATHLELRVLGASADADDWREVRAQTVGSPIDWPRSLGLVPREGETDRRFDVYAAARQGADGPVVAQARVLSSYVPEQTRELRLTLEDACIDRSCAETETCRAGMCVPPVTIDPATLGRPDRPSVSAAGCPEGMLRIPVDGASVTFVMGSPEGTSDANADEQPTTVVTLDAYCLDVTEVTARAYQQCVEVGGCAAATSGDECAGACNGGLSERLDHPMNCVSAPLADAYCRWRGARMPTEAEWELAARGLEGRTYPWGEEEPPAYLGDLEVEASDLANAAGWWEEEELYLRCRYEAAGVLTGDGVVFTAPVGSFPRGRGPYGHLDLAGNVWEWVYDCYAPYLGGSTTNPIGPVGSCSERAVRGGGWNVQAPGGLRGAHRSADPPQVRYPTVGFRCARGT